ncbi:TetR/AcrR family transcriptional regulator [Nocardia vinacea]|uniref:TetR/AcrR family transcriptional regulator n=1 Tax=Nocardia vinacea TaxID=96468 RepID=A0ABZ1Z6Y5_9NOCA|nr:TetR/AcrR family transcriptional regulator [Nocardia vinacea]
MTLYRHFGSKEALVEAFLIDRDQRLRAKFEREVERPGDSGRERVLAVFDFLGRDRRPRMPRLHVHRAHRSRVCCLLTCL